jgi:23S rRNA (uracil1939-C5)-methyltransferase
MAPSTNMKTNQPARIQAEIEKWVYGGDGLARVDGQVVLLPFVLPGEKVEASVRQVKNGLLRASDVRVIDPAPLRILPACEYFTRCGGCQYQHAPYEFQLSEKVAILKETLRRIGGIEYDGEIPVLSGDPWSYRNRVQLHFEKGRSGFRRAGSHELCPVDHCPISSPSVSAAIGKLSAAAKAPQWPRFVSSVELFSNDRELQLTIAETTRPVAARFFEWCGTFLPSLAQGAIDYDAAGFTFRISRGSFFQVNRYLVDALVNEVLLDQSGNSAIDLYAGVGLFSLPLSRRFGEVKAVERGGPAFRDLGWNTQTTPHVQPSKGSAEDFLRDLETAPDLIVADPPRAGLGVTATAELVRLRPSRLTIVSCDPATLSRDLKVLLSAYAIERLTLVDLFPQTFHFETVVHLRAN